MAAIRDTMRHLIEAIRAVQTAAWTTRQVTDNSQAPRSHRRVGDLVHPRPA